MLNTRLLIFLLLCTQLAGCNTGDDLLVGGISGPTVIDESSVVEYSLTASGDSDIAYAWAVDPAWAGTFGNPNSPATDFRAAKIAYSFPIEIRIIVTSEVSGPVFKSLNVNLINTIPGGNHPPQASATADCTVVKEDCPVQFSEHSSDPDGIVDLVKWEWDFSYERSDGFQPESDEENPIRSFPNDGTYDVQLRVTDASGFTDLLDVPLCITVLEPSAPVAVVLVDAHVQPPDTPVTFSGADSFDPDLDEIVKYEWDWDNDGYYDSTGIEVVNTWHDYGSYFVQLRVTDEESNTDVLDEPLELRIDKGWGLSWGRPYVFDTCNDIYVDTFGQIYTVGKFWGIVDFDPGPGVFELETSSKYGHYHSNGFLSVLDLYGNFVNALRWEGDNTYTTGVTVDGYGNAYVCGDYTLTLDLDPGPGEELAEPMENRSCGCFVVRLDNGLNLDWTWHKAGFMHRTDNYDPYDYDKYFSTGIAVTDSGFTYLAGNNNDGYGQEAPHSSESWRMECNHAAIRSFDSSGNVFMDTDWGGCIYQMGGVSEPDDPGLHESLDIAIGPAGSEYYIYQSSGYIPVGDGFEYYRRSNLCLLDDPYANPAYIIELSQGVASAISVDTAGNVYIAGESYFLSRLDGYGNDIWTVRWGNQSSEAEITDIQADRIGNVYVLGIFTSPVDFDPGESTCLLEPQGDHDIFISRFNENGQFIWASAFTGVGEETPVGLALDSLGALYIAGDFEYPIDLDPGPAEDIFTTDVGRDIFMVKLLPNGLR